MSVMETEENLEEQRDEIISEETGESTDDTPEDAAGKAAECEPGTPANQRLMVVLSKGLRPNLDAHGGSPGG